MANGPQLADVPTESDGDVKSPEKRKGRPNFGELTTGNIIHYNDVRILSFDDPANTGNGDGRV